MRRSIPLALALLAAALTPVARATVVPSLQHVFVIFEENQNYSDVMGNTAQAPYLNALANAHVQHDAYYGISHVSLGNYTGFVSGQIPHPLDHFDCPTYPACVRNGPTIAAQLDGASKTWRGYFSGMGTPCRHPTGPIDQDQNGYATRHDPFVYFHEIVDDSAYCAAHVVDYSSFAGDLAGTTPNFSFIVPDTCEDGHDSGCDGNKTTIQVMDEWLAANVPPILAYVNSHADSALFVTFDESNFNKQESFQGCCNQLPYVQGGGHIGFVMVAPGHETAGTHATSPANHYSLLRTIEDALGLGHLAEAQNVSSMTDLFS